MTIFRPCPTFPGFSASLCGTIRRDARQSITKLGKIRDHAASIMSHTGRDHLYVALPQGWARWSTMVADAWTADEIDAFNDRPMSDYPDGRVVTLAELIAERSR